MHNRTIKNAAWIIGCRIIQSGLALAVTMLSARYLGPSGYGLINYAASLVAFFVPVMQLGLNSTLVREIIADPEHEGETMGTALAMTFTSSIACLIGIATVSTCLNWGETETIVVCILYSLLLVFQSLEMIQFWFQAKLLSKYTSLTILAAYVIVAAYRITLLLTGRSIYWYAVSQAIDFAIIAAVLLILFRKVSGSRLRFSAKRAADMLGRSKHYILSSMMVTIFAQTDRIMLKMMLDEAAVGYYSAAVSCATLTAFVFVAIIDSARPSILEGKQTSDEAFQKRMKTLYAVIICLALLQSAVITLLAKPIIHIMCGADYGVSVNALRIVVWFSTFSYLGAVRDIWILAEKKQKYLWIINLSGAAANVLLNAVLIPLWGVNGAAIASLVTQFFTNVIMGWIIRPISPSNQLMLQSLSWKFLSSQRKEMRIIKWRN